MPKGRNRLDWIQTALILAHKIAECRSEDPYVQVGACGIQNDNKIVLGYNGAPPDIDLDWSNRDERRPYVLHAEANVLDLVEIGSLKLLAVTHLPCPECLKRIAKYKVKEVFYSSTNYSGGKDTKSFEMAAKLNVRLVQIG